MPRSQSRLVRRLIPRYIPSIEAMETREMLSASPTSPQSAVRALQTDSVVRDVVSRDDHQVLGVVGTAQRSATATTRLSEARLDRQYVLAIRAADPKAYRSMLATVRAADRPAWNAIARAIHSGSPAGWTLILSSLRTHFPATTGIPSQRPGDAVTPASRPTLALPLGVNFDLGTRWSQVNPTNPTNYQAPSLVAMSPDSTTWAVYTGFSSNTLFQYDPQGQAWYNVWYAPGPISSISAGPSNASTGRTLVASYEVNGVPYLAVLSSPATYGVFVSAVSYRIPNNPTAVQVATTQVMGASQPVWELGDGNLFRWSGTARNPTWTPISTGGLQLRQITVVSSNELWAIAAFPGTSQPTRAYRLVQGSWQAGPDLTGLTSLAGTGDGTLWAEGSGGSLYTLSSDGSKWQPVISLSAVVNQPSTITDVVVASTYTAFAAGSKYRAAAADPNNGVQLLTYGLADQPAVGYPALNSGEQLGYNYINQYLGITAPGGVRSFYLEASDVQSLTGYQGNLLTLTKQPVPAGLSISLADWKAITQEVYNEVFSVVAVYNYFDLIQSLTNELGTEVPQVLSNTSQQIDLSKDQQGAEFGAIFDQIFSAALGGIVKAFSGAAGVAASLIASGINAAISDVTKGQSDRTYSLNYYKLSTTLLDIFESSNATNSALETAILSDPTRFLPFGAGVTSGTLGWPVATSETIAASTLRAFQAYYLEVLTPLKWPLYYGTEYPSSAVEGSWPDSSSYFQPDSPGSKYGTLYVIGTPGTFGFDFPDPSLNLIPTILTVTGATKAQLFTNQLGWFHPIERSAAFFLFYSQG